jgi:hypothetical protein
MNIMSQTETGKHKIETEKLTKNIVLPFVTAMSKTTHEMRPI